ncbi:hypothetical protein [Streptomyces sp. NBC_00557]|uniref:hypothetical protein n=1 Tax=Streptomyces sp. NBC_00557 TaxID=2975776 RepID=UPI002E7FDCD4|nr:hypothetical protein [Streptomyces sp. NBC_00557]WUC39659.1 hypothetical protein OG956_38530 [Streptomyces sp. NBC_00557]
MTTFTTPHAQAAQRARTIAEIARDRFADGPIRAALLAIAAHMDRAADHLETMLPGADKALPTQAAEQLSNAEHIAAKHPAARFPAELGAYVLAPLAVRALPLPAPLHPVTPRLALRETDLRNRLIQLHEDDDHQEDYPEEWLRSVFTTWQKFMRLADEVRVDNLRPCNQD